MQCEALPSMSFERRGTYHPLARAEAPAPSSVVSSRIRDSPPVAAQPGYQGFFGCPVSLLEEVVPAERTRAGLSAEEADR